MEQRGFSATAFTQNEAVFVISQLHIWKMEHFAIGVLVPEIACT